MSAPRSNPVAIILAVLLLFSIAYNISLSGKLKKDLTVKEVVDGDSIILDNDQRVRLRGIDAPEEGRCAAHEAKIRLTELIGGKRVHLKNTIVDSYGRSLSHVYVGSIFVNAAMLDEGLARMQDEGTEAHEVFSSATNHAREAKVGIYSQQCRTTTPPDPKCAIKGNIRSGKKQFYLASCEFYNQVVVDTSFGDQWFCTQSQAKKEEFTLADTCSR